MADNVAAVPVPTLAVVGSSDLSITGGACEFDAVEHPSELELGPEVNFGDEDHEDEDDNGGSDDEDSEYQFRFRGDMDPLSFVEDEDASGLQLYERFERIQHHYEDELAAQKRPALQQCVSGTPAKRPRQEEAAKQHKRPKIRGPKKGSKNKHNPVVSRKLGDATLHYAHGRFEEAFTLLNEVILMAPNLSDSYHTLGLIYTAINDNKRALNLYMLAAHLNPKNASLWKFLVSRSIEQGDKRQANYCLNKAIIADPEDTGLLDLRASLYVELGEYHKAAKAYEQITNLCPDKIEVLSEATMLYKRCGQCQRAIAMLEGYLKNHVRDDNLGVVDLLASLLMESNEYGRALEQIEHIKQACGAGKEIPLYLSIKAGICHAHLGHPETAEAFFSVLKPEDAYSHPDVIVDVADSLMIIGQYESSLKYYFMLEETANKNHGYLHLKIARCYVLLGERAKAIEFYYKAIQELDDCVDTRLALSSLLLDEDRSDEAISVLSPPVESDSLDAIPSSSKLWWLSGKIKLKLSQIYKSKGSVEAFVDALFPIIRETMLLETVHQKFKNRKRLSRSVLSERVKVLDDQQTDRVFQGFRPVASSAVLNKATRAKRLLRKKAAEKEANKAAALAAGIDWYSDDSDDDSPQVFRRPPLPDFLKEEENHLLIVDLCKSLSSLGRYWDALEIVNLSLKLECNALPVQTKEELRTLGAQMAYNIADPAHGWDYVRYVVSRHPYSSSAWNCYYKAILRSNGFLKRNKFLHTMRVKHKDSVPPILISAHQFTMISQHQAAAREYLEAHKLMPENPLINLCAGTALINLALGFRLQNKHHTILQALAFLYNNLRLCEDNQEALFNIARAYNHVGLVSLAAKYYERVLALHPKDCPIPTLPNETPVSTTAKRASGYCDLRREAAYNLHLIYKNSGAPDLARQILKDHLVL